ncbi:MAG: ThiF family adenylyltransferase [Chloroflexota bacterium]
MTFFLHETHYRDIASIADRPITICGAGALGANMAETLARMGFTRLRVIDRDRIEAHNLSTQPWTQQDVGAPKARVLANALYRAVGARVDPKHSELTPDNAESLLKDSAIIVDAFDNLPSRGAVADAATKLSTPCLHTALGPNGDYGCGLWDDRYVVHTNEQQSANNQPDECDYPLTRPLALLVVASGAEVLVRHLLDGQRADFEVTLSDLRLVLNNS